MTNKVLVNILLDETGSMLSHKNDTIEGFNSYLAELKRDKETEYFVTLTKFNSEKNEVVYLAKPLNKVAGLNSMTYTPDANTPLFDAIGKTSRSVSEYLKENKDLRVLLIIFTDGQENASQEYSREAIVNLIKEKELEGWNFIYLGANQNAWEDFGKNIGLNQNNTLSYSTNDMVGTFSAVAAATSTYSRSGVKTTSNFFSS